METPPARESSIFRGCQLFVLDTNNGLLALNVVARLFQRIVAGTPVYRWSGPNALQSSTNVVTGYANVVGATSPHMNNNTAAATFFRLRRRRTARQFLPAFSGLWLTSETGQIRFFLLARSFDLACRPDLN